MIRTNEQVIMSDGTRLNTYIFKVGKPAPTVFARSPYDPMGGSFSFGAFSEAFVVHGYNLVYQQCRGTADSEGVFLLFDSERNDGLDTLEWIRHQDFYNGEIFLAGNSYLSWVHLSYMSAPLPDVKGAVLDVFHPDLYDLFFENGTPKWGIFISWAKDMFKIKETLNRDFGADIVLRDRPLTDSLERAFGTPVPEITNALIRPDRDDPYWQLRNSIYKDLSSVDFPILFNGSFHDIFIEGMIKMWRGLTDSQKAVSAFNITPYGHEKEYTPNLPEYMKSPNAGLDEFYPLAFINFFDHIRGKDTLGNIKLGKINYYTLNGKDGYWDCADDLTGNGSMTLHLHGDRMTHDKENGQDRSFDYDPKCPPHFKGGICNGFDAVALQDAPNTNDGILSFVSDAFESPVHLFGSSVLKFKFKSDCEDTGVYARLSLVKENGDTLGLRDRIASISHFDKYYRPNNEIEIILGFCENSFIIDKGDRLRIDISSACFPHFAPHTNFRGNQAEIPNVRTAHNTVMGRDAKFTFEIKTHR